MHAKITHTSGIIMYILANDFFSSNDTIVFFVFCFFSPHSQCFGPEMTFC